MRQRLVGLMVVVISVVVACGGDEKDSAFCRGARTSVTQLEQAYATLAEATQGVGQVDLDEARAQYAAAVDALIRTLQAAPEEIRAAAADTADGLRQQLSTLGDVQPGTPPAPFPPDRQAAAGHVDSYLQQNCEFSGSVTPR